MKDFNAVIGIDGIDVLDRRHDFSMSGIITTEFIRDEPAGALRPGL